MSYFALGSVTQAMATLLARKLTSTSMFGNVRVTTLPPDHEKVSEDTGINLFLYRVSEHPNFKNMPWRGDQTHPKGTRRPPLTLTLNYLMTPYCKTTQDDITAHHLLGSAMAVFNEFPVLNHVHDADFDADLPAFFDEDLNNAFEDVKVSLMPSTIEEITKIWTGLTKAYRLSVAYEVSLVQIASQRPEKGPAPPARHPVLKASTIGAPLLSEVSPEFGPVGGSVTITGGPFTSPGEQIVVEIGGVEVPMSSFTVLSEDRLVFAVPATLQRGPHVDITVAVGGRRSNRLLFRVTPWIAGMAPVRGTGGVTVTIPFAVPDGATVTADVGGVSVPGTVAAEGQSVSLAMPPKPLTNGPLPVALLIDDGALRRTNALSFEVMPTISSFSLQDVGGGVAKTAITVRGERLAGSAVSVRLGSIEAKVPEDAPNDGTELRFEFPRRIDEASLSVIVDGRETNRLERRLDAVEPASAAAGATVTLRGIGLAGAKALVHFGDSSVDVGASVSNDTISAIVPATPAGTVMVSATVDGSTTGALPFTVAP
jgi:hypothetical protein